MPFDLKINNGKICACFVFAHVECQEFVTNASQDGRHYNFELHFLSNQMLNYIAVWPFPIIHTIRIHKDRTLSQMTKHLHNTSGAQVDTCVWGGGGEGGGEGHEQNRHASSDSCEDNMKGAAMKERTSGGSEVGGLGKGKRGREEGEGRRGKGGGGREEGEGRRGKGGGGREEGEGRREEEVGGGEREEGGGEGEGKGGGGGRRGKGGGGREEVGVGKGRRGKAREEGEGKGGGGKERRW